MIPLSADKNRVQRASSTLAGLVCDWHSQCTGWCVACRTAFAQHIPPANCSVGLCMTCKRPFLSGFNAPNGGGLAGEIYGNSRCYGCRGLQCEQCDNGSLQTCHIDYCYFAICDACVAKDGGKADGVLLWYCWNKHHCGPTCSTCSLTEAGRAPWIHCSNCAYKRCQDCYDGRGFNCDDEDGDGPSRPI